MTYGNLMRILFLLALAALMLSPAMRAHGQALEPIGNYGYIDWTNMRAVASGLGVPPDSAMSMGQWQAMAARASVVDAQRNLLEVVKGVHIDSTTTVHNFETEQDAIVSRISGVLTGARVIETIQLADGSFQSIVAMPLDGDLGRELLTLLPETRQDAAPLPETAAAESTDDFQDELPAESLEEPEEPMDDPVVLEEPFAEPAAETAEAVPPVVAPVPLGMGEGTDAAPAEADAPYTGLVLDARNLGFRPSLRPEVYGPDGPLYPGPAMSEGDSGGQGLVRYYQDPDQARQSTQTGENPLTVTALGLYQDNESALVIGAEDAAMLEEILAEPGNFLDSGRVVIVF